MDEKPDSPSHTDRLQSKRWRGMLSKLGLAAGQENSDSLDEASPALQDRPEPAPADAPRSNVIRIDPQTLLDTLCDVATGLWRMGNRLDELPDDAAGRAVRRHAQSAQAALLAAGLETRDPTGEPYHTGQAMHVLEFQPGTDRDEETVLETIKPAIYLRDTLVQRAQVIVALPDQAALADTAPAPPSQHPSDTAASTPSDTEHETDDSHDD